MKRITVIPYIFIALIVSSVLLTCMSLYLD